MPQFLVDECFVTIRIFARTELEELPVMDYKSFVTIRIFARTELTRKEKCHTVSFVTI